MTVEFLIKEGGWRTKRGREKVESGKGSEGISTWRTAVCQWPFMQHLTFSFGVLKSALDWSIAGADSR